MFVLCAWCKAVIGEGGAGVTAPASHGICNTCRSHLMASFDGIPLAEFLDSLPVPIAVVDNDVRVVYANPSAQAALRRSPLPIEGRLGGDVLECENSYRPGGCGHTDKCSACTFRNAVNRCFETGRDEDVVATIRQQTGADARDLTMHFATKRVDGQVLITIDHVKR